MRLLILSTEFPPGPGGIGTHAYQLAQGLSQKGWDVTVVARQDYTEQATIVNFNTSQNFKILALPPIAITPLDAFHRWYLCQRTIMTNKIELVVATGVQSVWLSTLLTCKIVAIGHGTEFGATGSKSLLTRWTFEQANHVICVSEFTRQYMQRKNIRPSNVSVIPNGADEKIFQVKPSAEIKAFRRVIGFSEIHELLLTVGNTTSRKGQDVVIRSLPYLLKDHPNLHYLIAGLRTMESELTKLASELGVLDHVHFLGKVPTSVLVSLYNACQIFVMTSRHTKDGDFEGYGIAVIEAALCGKAAVVSGGSGLAEAVIDGETGLIVPQNDPQATALAINTLLTDPELLSRLAFNARVRAITKGTWMEKTLEYHQLLSDIVKS